MGSDCDYITANEAPYTDTVLVEDNRYVYLFNLFLTGYCCY